MLTISEIFTFITVDVKAYMPPMQTVTIYFLKDLITGKKRCKYSHPWDPVTGTETDFCIDVPMDSPELRQIHVPSFENLSLKLIYSFFEKFPSVLSFLPDGKELIKAPKAWICNIGATVIGSAF